MVHFSTPGIVNFSIPANIFDSMKQLILIAIILVSEVIVLVSEVIILVSEVIILVSEVHSINFVLLTCITDFRLL